MVQRWRPRQKTTRRGAPSSVAPSVVGGGGGAGGVVAIRASCRLAGGGGAGRGLLLLLASGHRSAQPQPLVVHETVDAVPGRELSVQVHAREEPPPAEGRRRVVPTVGVVAKV